jgi:CTP:phosphocholine cytidylyltransferase-like protein
MKQKSRHITSVKGRTSEDKRDEKITFIFLAENYGYRMKSYGPVPLIQIGEKTLLEHQVQAIQSAFIDFEIILCSGFETQKVYHFVQQTFAPSVPIRIVENQVYFHSNCCEGLRLCMNNTRSERIVICGGGVLLTVPYLRSLNIKKSSILYQESSEESTFEIGVIDNGTGERLETLSLAVKDRVWTDLLYLNGESMVKSFYNTISKPELKTKFLFEAINAWRGRRQLFLSENKDDKIIKVDNIKTLKRITEQ